MGRMRAEMGAKERALVRDNVVVTPGIEHGKALRQHRVVRAMARPRGTSTVASSSRRSWTLLHSRDHGRALSQHERRVHQGKVAERLREVTELPLLLGVVLLRE